MFPTLPTTDYYVYVYRGGAKEWRTTASYREPGRKCGVCSRSPGLGVGRLRVLWGGVRELRGKQASPGGLFCSRGLFGSQRGNPRGAAELRRGPGGCRQERAASF